MINEDDPEINNIINRYSRKHMSNYITQKQILDESEQNKELEMMTRPELEEESVNYQSKELQDNEDMAIETTTRQKLDAYLTNGIFQKVISFTSFFFFYYYLYYIYSYNLFPFNQFVLV